MDSNTDTLKKIHTAGTVNLVVGILNSVGVVLLLIFGIILILINTQIPGEKASDPPIPSVLLGVILLIVAFFVLIFAILNIIAGSKLRKPIPNPKNWLIYTIVVGAINIGSVTGILQLIFGIMAFSSLDHMNKTEATKPAEQ